MGLYRIGVKDGQKALEILAGATRGEGCPLGSIIAYPSDTLPNDNWLFCDGSTFDETKYPVLYLLLGDNKVPNMNKIIRYDYENPQTFPGNGELNWTATSDGLFYPSPYVSSGNAYSASITINGTTYTNILSAANSNFNNNVFELKKGDVIRMYGDWSSRTDAKFVPAITCNCIIKATSNMNESEASGILNLITERQSYSTTEHWTGKYWIDGKKIYRRVYNINLTFSSQSWQNSGITNADIDKITKSYCYGYDQTYSAQYIKFPAAGVSKNTNNELMVWANNYGNFTQMCIEYTKTTD